MYNLIVDISGKVEIYDRALLGALREVSLGDDVSLIMPGDGLVSLVPSKLKSSDHIIKRLVKVAEGLLNYVLTFVKVVKGKPDILHLQWLPFMEVNGWEVPILRCLKKISSKTKLVLTIHNVYPHNMSEKQKRAYNARFRKVSSVFDAFIVHTEISKEEVVREFALNNDMVYVCCHGVFKPNDATISNDCRKGGKLHILQFGGQSYYKGTDLLVDAVCGLDDKHKTKVETHIVGGISQSFMNELKAKDKDSLIKWKAYFLNNNELYQEINDSDVIILPYRAISQSGVLLLSIYFEKLIICSDLPSFKQTMRGEEDNDIDDSLFFKSEDSSSLRNLLCRYIDHNIDETAVKERVKRLKKFYTWERAAKSTLNVYRKITTTYN